MSRDEAIRRGLVNRSDLVFLKARIHKIASEISRFSRFSRYNERYVLQNGEVLMLQHILDETELRSLDDDEAFSFPVKDVPKNPNVEAYPTVSTHLFTQKLTTNGTSKKISEIKGNIGEVFGRFGYRSCTILPLRNGVQAELYDYDVIVTIYDVGAVIKTDDAVGTSMGPGMGGKRSLSSVSGDDEDELVVEITCINPDEKNRNLTAVEDALSPGLLRMV